MNQLDLLTSSQEGIPASHSVLPGSDEARQMTATSGRSLLGLYENSGRVGLLAKTLLAISTWASTTCYLTWKDSATPGKRLLFRLALSAPTTGETVSGLLHTPTASGNQMASSMREKYPGAYGLLPTPTTIYTRENWSIEEIMRRQAEVKAATLKKGKHHTGNGFGLNLAQAARLWPTPTATMHKGSSPAALTRRNGRDRTNDRLDHKMQAVEGSGSLNPTWVEWLMGYPIGWTELRDSGTPSSPKSQK